MPVVTSVSQATRASGSGPRIASRTASEIWSAILSGCPSVTDSDVKTWRAMVIGVARGGLSLQATRASAAGQPHVVVEQREIERLVDGLAQDLHHFDVGPCLERRSGGGTGRSEEHTSALQ